MIFDIYKFIYMNDTLATHLKCPSFIAIHLEMVKSNQKAIFKSFNKPLK